MANAKELFFEELGKKRHVQLLEGRSGTVLVELKNGEKGQSQRWYVNVHRGDVSVSRSGSNPDSVFRTDSKTFAAIVAGKMNTIPALLRGLVEVEGRIDLIVALQTLYRPSTGAPDQRTAGYAGRRS